MSQFLRVWTSPEMEQYARSINQEKLTTLIEHFNGDGKRAMNEYLACHGQAFVFTLFIEAGNIPIGIFEDVDLACIEGSGGYHFEGRYYSLNQLFLDMRIIKAS